MIDIQKEFGSLVFNDNVMKERLPKPTYNAFKKCLKNSEKLDRETADIIANAMKDWAIENGATHFTHWFQPMTGMTAEKHDSFISVSDASNIFTEFSGKELIKGEPDASSFPSGGLRATFEARGYTNWDPSSYAFIKDDTLCIPTAFCSYSGEALDKKTPLLRSMEAVRRQTKRLGELFGTNVESVETTIGPEQEYFLIDRALFKKRRDIVYTGRTLFGAKPPKGQELEDHYFGTIRPRVHKYMKELNLELWRLGVYAKTEHNEVAPSQHELAPVFTSANVAVDHNQLTMETMKKVAAKFDLACLLHEKPFAGVNGSGKHTNWSVAINGSDNLFEPGKTPEHNLRFLICVSAIIYAIDEYQDLMRIASASAGNDHRLGANEAPPAIISIYLGDELTDILESIATHKTYEAHKKKELETGVDILPAFKRDTTDRNRTSPFAFTGNKFEFRMPGSSFSVSEPALVLNTIFADTVSDICDKLEKNGVTEKSVYDIVGEIYSKHCRIVFNGNNYSQDWVDEAANRGLLNLATTADALPYLIKDKNIELFERQGVFTRDEIYSRYEIYLENYSKVLNIEALTMISMTKKDIMPAVISYSKKLADAAKVKMEVAGERACQLEKKQVENLSSLLSCLSDRLDALESAVIRVKDISDFYENACAYRDCIIPAMNELRAVVDELETKVDRKEWPLPSYGELLFSF